MNLNIKNANELINELFPKQNIYCPHNDGIKLMHQHYNDYGWADGELYLYLGCSGSWKSGFMLYNLLYTSCRFENDNDAVLYISYENSERETQSRLINMKVSEKLNYKHLIVSHPKKDDENDVFDINNIKGIIDSCNQTYSIKMVAVDYPGEMDIEKGRNSYEEYGKIAYQLKKLAEDYNIPVITAMQTNKSVIGNLHNSTETQDKLLSLSKVSMADISESSKFAHISDHVYFIYRLNQAMFPEYSRDYLFIKSLKQRTNSLSMEYTFIPFSKNFEILEKNKYVDLIIKENN